MGIWTALATELMQQQPHKRLNYLRGLEALSRIQSTL